MSLEKRFCGEPAVTQVPRSLLERQDVFDRLMMDLSKLGVREIKNLFSEEPSTLEQDAERVLDSYGITDAAERDAMMDVARLWGRVL